MSVEDERNYNLPEPRWQGERLVCRQCDLTWNDWAPVRVPVDVWVAVMRTKHCPKCLSDDVLIGMDQD